MDTQQGLAVELDRKNEQLNSPFRNPWLMIALGIIAGGIATGVALKGK